MDTFHIISCPICESAKVYRICKLKGSRTGNYSPLYLCSKCNFYYQRPDYREDDSTLQDDLKWHIDQATLNSETIKNELKLILKYHPSAKSLLDIGCGIGATMSEAFNLGLFAQGVEPNPHAVKYAKDHMSYNLVEGYFDKNMFPKKFDIVILDMVLEHVHEPKVLISEIFKVLNPGGILFLSVPNRLGGTLRILYSILNRSGYKSLFDDNDVHINHFSKRSIEILLAPFKTTILHQPQPGTYIIRCSEIPI